MAPANLRYINVLNNDDNNNNLKPPSPTSASPHVSLFRVRALGLLSGVTVGVVMVKVRIIHKTTINLLCELINLVILVLVILIILL